MIHAALCILAIALAWRTPQVKSIAILYGAIQICFWLIRNPAESYGESWWWLCIAIELITIWSLRGSDHGAAKWIIRFSWSAIIINLVCTPKDSPIYHLYDYLIPCSEYARALCIIIASNPIWSKITRWHDTRKKDYTWLAKHSTPTLP